MPILRKQDLYCPVCKKENWMGSRFKSDAFTQHCAECRAEYTWMPFDLDPTVKMDVDKPIRCGCGCGN